MMSTSSHRRSRASRRSRSIVSSRCLNGRPAEEIAAVLVPHVVTTASRGPRAGRSASSARKALRKILERAPLEWLNTEQKAALLRECLQRLDEEVRILELLQKRYPLAWVAEREGLDETRLRDALRDPRVRHHYAWPEYSPVDGETYFNAARFDHAAQVRLVVPAQEPPGRVLAPGWSR